MKTPRELKNAAKQEGVTPETAAMLKHLGHLVWVLDGTDLSILSIKVPKPVLGEISRLMENEGQIEQPTEISPFYALKIADRIWIRTPDVSVEVRSKLIFEELAA